ncbi:hypothetical protein ABEB36_006187 [Hypothenemus hampei]|uniref:Enhancer of polycomb-like protein n=1 Tax=Hypothenemus hampei TaxID=57062 RepID=A0ABD1ERV1_HYPHA
MSKLSFRARALDPSKPMPIFMAEELPDLPDFSAINRAVPQMPTGMQKEEECEHHLQRAICAGIIIPTPEVSDVPLKDFYDRNYPNNYKQPRQLIHMQPFTMEQEIPDYDMDSDDEKWLQTQRPRLDITPLKFEEMMDRLEKSSGQTVVTLTEAKALLKEDDELTIAVFDYWLNKRLKTQHPLILTVRTEHRSGQAANNPYLAFRRRTEKMQTRKNRKNDEVSYEKMLKLRRDLVRAVTLLELVKRREKCKREYVHLTVEVFEKRFQARDFSGMVVAEAQALKAATAPPRPAFTPIFHNHNQSWADAMVNQSQGASQHHKAIIKDDVISRREKRQYKKRKHKMLNTGRGSGGGCGLGPNASLDGFSSDEDGSLHDSTNRDGIISGDADDQEDHDEGPFMFRRNRMCSYHKPLPTLGNWSWCSRSDNGSGDKRFRFTLASLSNRKCIGFARRRMGRGGRVILDRIATDYDDFWRSLDFSIIEPRLAQHEKTNDTKTLIKQERIKKDGALLNSIGSGSNISNSGSTSLVHNNNYNMNNNNNSETYNNSGGGRYPPKRDSDLVNSSTGDFYNNDLVVSERLASVMDVKPEPHELINKMATTNCDVGKTNQEEQQDDDEDDDDDDDGGGGGGGDGDDGDVVFLHSLRRDWLHFRPKTPPPDYEPPCNLLPPDDPWCAANSLPSFQVEIEPLEGSTILLDHSLFTSETFELDKRWLEETTTTTTTTNGSDDQQHQQLQDEESQKDSAKEDDVDGCPKKKKKWTKTKMDDWRIVGVSNFKLRDVGGEILRTVYDDEITDDCCQQEDDIDEIKTAEKNKKKKLMVVASTAVEQQDQQQQEKDQEEQMQEMRNTNGLISQIGFRANVSNLSNRNHSNKLKPFTYSPTNNSATAMSRHAVSLNNHGANNKIIEFPLTAAVDVAVNSAVENQASVTNNAANQKSTPNGGVRNNKTNNMVMEVT